MKNLNTIFSVLLILLTSSLVYGQSWTIYQADLDPLTEFSPAFEESNKGGVFERTQIADPDNASNSLLRIITDQDTDATSDNYQLRQQIGATTPTAITVVFRAKGNDPAKFFLFDMDMDFNMFRSQIRIHNDGTVDVANGTPTVAPDPLTINTQEWNTYRYTRDGDQFALYVNEDPTPVVTGTAQAAGGNNFFRFGDGWGSSGTRGISTDFDWATWDLTGAYSPADQALPPELVGDTPVGDWTLYNADVDPTGFDPAFSESNGAGTYAYGTLVDPDDAGNNLLSIKTDLSAAAKDNIQLRQYTDAEEVTVVLKARTVDLANKNLLFDMDFRSTLSTRFAIKVLNDGTYDIDKGGDGIVADKGDWGFTSTEWNIFRFTKSGNDVNIYINEDPTPVFTMTAVGTADGSGYWRFGDGWSSEDVDTQYDWVTWDYTGAYSPEEARLPDELVDQEVPVGDWAIYNADVEPTAFDPAFSESNGAGTFTYGILADDYIAGNNLLSIKTDLSAAAKDNIQLRQYTDAEEVTVVLKARTVDLANKNLLFDMDFRSTLSTRFAIKVLNDGTYDIDKGGDGIVADKGDWGFTSTEWNIFRFTKSGNDVNIYINEDPTPVFTMTAVGTADGSGYWRFGDGWSSEDVDTQYDWVTWDYTGAYAPTDTRLPDELVKPPLGDWTVYNADVEPIDFDPAFSESNGAGTFTYGTLVDPDDATNNLLNIKTDLSAAAKDNIQLRQYSDAEALTVVLKARTVDLANKNLLFDMDFRSSLSTRFAIKVLNDGTYDIDKGGDGVVPDKDDWGFISTDWNIFRFTKNGNDVNIYINEDPTPVFTMTAVGTADGSGYWRFGDGWSSEDVDTQYDWVTWDYTGAYSPEQTRLPDELIKPPLGDWTVYNADVEPTAFDPAFSESNNAGTFTYGTLVDPDDATNNLLNIKTDLSAAAKDNIQLRQYTDIDAVTVVLKARTVDLANKNLLFDMDFRSDLSTRFAIKVLNDGTYDIDKGGDGVVPDKDDWGFISTDWNIFRFTKNGNDVNIYINEDPTPVFTMTAVGTADGSGYWRFGDGWSSEDVDTQYDWVTWDYTGAYAPDQARLPDELTGEGGDQPDPKIKILGSIDPLSQDLGFAPDFTIDTYKLSGTDLTDNITITPPVNFEVSVDTTNWFTNANPLVIEQTGGIVEDTIIIVRLNASAVGEFSGQISNISAGAEDELTDVSGTTVELIPELTITGTLDGFVQNISTASSSQNYRVSGVNLKDSVTVTAPTGYEVSADDLDWGTSFKLGGTDRTITNALVYVRQFGSTLGSLSGSITHTSLDAVEATIAVAGEVITDPGLTIEGELTGFSQSLGTPSEAQSYTLSGSSLTSNVSISLPDGFDISIDGDTWLNSLTLVPLEGAVETITLLIRLNAVATGTSSGNIVHSSTGVDDVNVAVSGTTNDIVLATELEPNSVAFAMWPNPAYNKITIQRENELGAGRVLIYSLQGELLIRYEIASGTGVLEIDISALENGVYLVGYEGGGNIEKQRFIKK